MFSSRSVGGWKRSTFAFARSSIEMRKAFYIRRRARASERESARSQEPRADEGTTKKRTRDTDERGTQNFYSNVCILG